MSKKAKNKQADEQSEAPKPSKKNLGSFGAILEEVNAKRKARIQRLKNEQSNKA